MYVLYMIYIVRTYNCIIKLQVMSEKKQTVQVLSVPKKIAKIQFGMLPTDEIKLVSELQVSNRELYQMPMRSSAPFGCMDSRLGISDKTSSCKTCK